MAVNEPNDSERTRKKGRSEIRSNQADVQYEQQLVQNLVHTELVLQQFRSEPFIYALRLSKKKSFFEVKPLRFSLSFSLLFDFFLFLVEISFNSKNTHTKKSETCIGAMLPAINWSSFSYNSNKARCSS